MSDSENVNLPIPQSLSTAGLGITLDDMQLRVLAAERRDMQAEIDRLRSALRTIAKNGGSTGWDGWSCAMFARSVEKPNAEVRGDAPLAQRPAQAKLERT